MMTGFSPHTCLATMPRTQDHIHLLHLALALRPVITKVTCLQQQTRMLVTNATPWSSGLHDFVHFD